MRVAFLIAMKNKSIELSIKQKLFCQYYIETFGNGTEAVLMAGYDVSKKNGTPDRNLAKSIASENLTKPDILACINGLLNKAGMNDEMVAVQHSFLIKQHQDLGIKTRAIDMYYKLRGLYKQTDSAGNGYDEILESAVTRIKSLLPD